MLRCYSCGNLLAVEPSGLCPRCLALRPVAGDGAETVQCARTGYPATWSILFITIVTSIAGIFFRQYGAPFGAEIPWRMVAGGEWWRLLTCLFVHQGFSHAFANLFLIWIFGRRLERMVGAGAFVGLYLICGLSGNVVSLAFDPERISYGASGAMYAVAAALIGIYGVKFSSLSNRQKWRLGFLVFFTVGTIAAGFFDDQVDNPAHVTGFLTGLFFGVLLASGFAQTSARRVWILAGMFLICLSACIWVQFTHSYLIHVDGAARAIDHDQYDLAARELHLALAMKPGSLAAQRFAKQVQADRTVPVNYCAALQPENSDLVRSADPCGGKQCDGRLRAFTAKDGSTAYYVGTVTASTPLAVSGSIEKEMTATVMMQALDEFGEIGCTVKWSQVSRQKVDAHGNPVGAIVTSESSGTVSVFDPQAESLHRLILSRK